MSEPVAWMNGQVVPVSQAQVSIFDLGLVAGASVTEMIRTFRHEPYRLDDHLARLFRSLRYVGFAVEMTQAELSVVVQEVVKQNATLIPATHDLGIVAFVTAGTNVTYVGAAGMDRAKEPTICVHTFPLPFELWAAKIEQGQHLVTPAVRHIPPDSLDPQIKSRSRLHWILADQQARLVDPKAGSLLLDHAGNVTETSSGNFFIVSDGTILAPPPETALGGISQMTVRDLAAELGIPFEWAQLRPYNVLNADEAFTSSTPYCLMPVARFNGRDLAGEVPGPIFRRLTAAWSEKVGLDVVEQITTGAAERLA